MKPEPLVSVVVDNFNYGRFLEEAVRSALDQSYSSIEVIVVDDGSTDESRDVIRRFGEDVRTILKANAGQASALNVGIAEAHGEILCFLDSDDRWDANKVAMAVEEMRGLGPDCAMLRHNLRIVDVHGTPTGRTALPRVPSRVVEHISVDLVLQQRRNVPTSALVAPRAALARLAPIPEAPFRVSADAYLYTHLPRLGSVATIPDVLGSYRVHGCNLYFDPRPSADRLANIFELEIALLRTVPSNTCIGDDILSVAHRLEQAGRPCLHRLGTVPERFQKLIGGRMSNLRSHATRRVMVRELWRTVCATW